MSPGSKGKKLSWDEFWKLIRELIEALFHPDGLHRATELQLVVSVTPQRRTQPMSSIATIGAMIAIQVVAKDALGNEGAVLPEVPKWAIADTSILNPVVAPDGMSASGAALKTGSVLVTVTSGSLTATTTVDVVAGDAVAMVLVVTVTPPAPNLSGRVPPSTQPPVPGGIHD